MAEYIVFMKFLALFFLTKKGVPIHIHILEVLLAMLADLYRDGLQYIGLLWYQGWLIVSKVLQYLYSVRYIKAQLGSQQLDWAMLKVVVAC